MIAPTGPGGKPLDVGLSPRPAYYSARCAGVDALGASGYSPKQDKRTRRRYGAAARGNHLAMLPAATKAVPKDAIARPSATVSAVLSSRIFSEDCFMGPPVLLEIIPEAIACSHAG
jgi:hypothetical protein